jgi:hypothetical protein
MFKRVATLLAMTALVGATGSAPPWGSDGAFASILIQHGNFAAVLPPGSDPGFGFYRVSGDWSSLSVNPDGTRAIALGVDGTAENMCDAMAD